MCEFLALLFVMLGVLTVSYLFDVKVTYHRSQPPSYKAHAGDVVRVKRNRNKSPKPYFHIDHNGNPTRLEKGDLLRVASTEHYGHLAYECAELASYLLYETSPGEFVKFPCRDVELVHSHADLTAGQVEVGDIVIVMDKGHYSIPKPDGNGYLLNGDRFVVKSLIKDDIAFQSGARVFRIPLHSVALVKKRKSPEKADTVQRDTALTSTESLWVTVARNRRPDPTFSDELRAGSMSSADSVEGQSIDPGDLVQVTRSERYEKPGDKLIVVDRDADTIIHNRFGHIRHIPIASVKLIKKIAPFKKGERVIVPGCGTFTVHSVDYSVDHEPIVLFDSSCSSWPVSEVKRIIQAGDVVELTADVPRNPMTGRKGYSRGARFLVRDCSEGFLWCNDSVLPDCQVRLVNRLGIKIGSTVNGKIVSRIDHCIYPFNTFVRPILVFYDGSRMPIFGFENFAPDMIA